jgi:aldose 1-epimerase
MTPGGDVLTETLVLAAGPLLVVLAPPIGGAVARFDWNREPIFRPAPDGFSDVLQAGCFPMVPYVNRIRDGHFRFRDREVTLDPMPGQRHPLHGHGWRAPWRVLSASLDEAVLAYSHVADAWPWAYEAQQAFRLDEQGLTVDLTLTNQSAEPMPGGLGLHPYFPCNDATVLDAAVSEVWTIDSEVMPVERRAAEGRYALANRRICGADLDNGYGGFSGRFAITWPDRSLAVTAEAPAARRRIDLHVAGGGVVVAEAVTHANAVLNLPEPDAVALGLKVVAPGETFALRTRFEVRHT